MSDEVLLEVPCDGAGDLLVGMARQEPVERALVVALDGDLGEDVEGSVLLGTKRLDRSVCTRLLAGEVVRWEGQDSKAFVFVALV